MTLEEVVQNVIERTYNEVDETELVDAIRKHIKEVAKGMKQPHKPYCQGVDANGVPVYTMHDQIKIQICDCGMNEYNQALRELREKI